MKPIRQISLLFLLITFLISCEKNNSSKNFYPYYKAAVNGKKLSVDACGTSTFVAEYLKDTAMFIGFGCHGQSAGFYLKGKINDGVYDLDGINRAFYSLGAENYQTDNNNKGTITIRSGTHKNVDGQNVVGQTPFIQGDFSFEAFDTNTGKKIKVTNGTYLFEKRYY